MQSNASTTDLSSAENPQQQPNDRKSLLYQSNQMTTDWYMDDEQSIESSQPDTERFNLADMNPASSLLTLPNPIDRSHDARRKQTNQTGNAYRYMGELEPAGVRGQEAQVRTQQQPSRTEIPLRTFEEEKLTEDEKYAMTQKGRENGTLSPIPEFLSSSSYNGFPSSNDSRSRQQPSHRRTTDSYNSSTSENFDRLEMIQNNIAEITSEEVQLPRGQNLAPSYRYPQSTSSPSTQLSPASGNASPVRPSVSRSNPSSPYRAGRDDATQLTSSSQGTNNTGPSSFRSSAPVDIDDSSFMDPVEHVQGIHAMAMEHVLRGEYDVALQAFSQVLQVHLEQHGRSHALTASAFHNLGTVHSKRAGLLLNGSLHQQNCREQALLCFQAAARSARDAPELGPSHPNVAVSLVRIGFLLLQTRQYENAVVTFSEALRIRIKHYGQLHSLVANLYNNLGVCRMVSFPFSYML
jgi:tetratricopeptide (TPR) repeat protein